jgi:glycerol-3-phosphate acyltransferase PlsY
MMVFSLIMLVIAYLLGSVSCAILVCKFAGLPDPRTQGSGNPGASNVLRVAGKTYAAITLLGDVLKGLIPVLLAQVLGLHPVVVSLVALAAVLGHMYPAFFKFQGGKGVATAIGAYFALSFPLGLITAIIWLGLAFLFRYASLASLAACALAPFICLIFNPAYFLGLIIIAALVVWRHWENIERLRQGTESKIVVDKPEGNV